METDRAITLLDETLARYHTIEADEIEAIADELKGIKLEADRLANKTNRLNLDGDDDEALEEREDVVGDLRSLAGWAEDNAIALEKLADRLPAK